MLLEDVGNQLPTRDDFISKLIPNWISFVTQLAALLVLIVVVIILAYKPVKKIITKRQDYIEDNIKQAEAMKLEAQNNFHSSEEKILASKKEANQIIADAKKEATEQSNKIIEDTNVMISKMKVDAEKDIEDSKIEAREEIRKEMVSLALEASKEVLKREVNSKDNSRLVDEFLKDIKD